MHPEIDLEPFRAGTIVKLPLTGGLSCYKIRRVELTEELHDDGIREIRIQLELAYSYGEPSWTVPDLHYSVGGIRIGKHPYIVMGYGSGLYGAAMGLIRIGEPNAAPE